MNRYTFTSVTHKLNKLSFKTPTEHSSKMLGPQTSINSLKKKPNKPLFTVKVNILQVAKKKNFF